MANFGTVVEAVGNLFQMILNLELLHVLVKGAGVGEQNSGEENISFNAQVRPSLS